MKKKHIMTYAVLCSCICITRFLYIQALSYRNQTHGQQPIVTCIPDRTLTKSVHKLIKKTAILNSYKALDTLKYLQKTMPLIKGLAIHNPGNNNYTIHIHTHQPHCTIITPTSWYTVAKNGAYTQKPFFETEKQNTIAHVTLLAQRGFTLSEVIEHLRMYNQKTLDVIAKEYALLWNKKTHIIYTHTHKNFCIVCTWQQQLTPEKIQMICTLAQKVPKLSKYWQADIRFKDQIVFSKIEKPLDTHAIVDRGDR